VGRRGNGANGGNANGENGGNTGRGWKSIVDSATTDITWIYLEKFF
jgi:hypothetical protein